MAEVTITAGRIKGDYCEYSFGERTLAGTQSVNVSSEAIVHDDMRKAFRQLVPHLAFMADYIQKDNQLERAMDAMSNLTEDDKLYEKLTEFKVTGFKVVGGGDQQGVVITGQKRLENGKLLNITTPTLKWEDDYEFVNELRIAVDRCQSEIIQYSDGKKAPDAQLEMFGDDDENYTNGEDL